MLKGTGLVLGGLAVPGFLEACLTSTTTTQSGSIKIGFVSPITGPASGFGEPDPYVIGLAKKAFKNGITVGGTNYSVEIVARDGQSTPCSRSAVAQDLIQNQKVDIMLATSTPETVNPVSDACEAAGVPCISTVVPWEAWYLGRGAKVGQPSPFKFTFHFCFGVEQFFNAYTHLWPQVTTNKKVGVMWPNDADGNAIRGALGPLLKQAGYTIVDPGAYEDGTNDYTAQIQKFISEDCQIFNTFPIPPDFATFWRQAAQQGYTKHVKIGQIAKTGSVSVAGLVARLDRQRPRLGCVLGADVALQVVADGDREQGSRQRIRVIEQQAVEPAARPKPGPVRRRGRGAQGERQPEGQGEGRGRDEDARRRHAGRSPRLVEAGERWPEPRFRTSLPPPSSAGSGSRMSPSGRSTSSSAKTRPTATCRSRRPCSHTRASHGRGGSRRR